MEFENDKALNSISAVDSLNTHGLPFFLPGYLTEEYPVLGGRTAIFLQ